MKAAICIGVLFLFIAVPIVTSAQTGATDTAIDSFDFNPSIHQPPYRPLLPATASDPRFQLRVQMQSGTWKYAGNHEYQGSGDLLLLATDRKYAFRYSCAYSFVPENQTYTARWIVPDKKLEILMNKPGSKQIKRCRIDTNPAPL